MCTISRYILVFLILLVMAKHSHAQYYNIYQSDEAVMLQVDGEARIESRLNKVVIILFNNSNLLNIRLRIPYHLMKYNPAENDTLSAGLTFDLKMNINPGQIQDKLTSAKSFLTHGFLTLNNITRPVMVEYIPLPAGPDQDGDFNLSMVIQLNSGDFDLGEECANSQVIIKLDNVTVNRV